jgi:hypothetical protein
MKGTKRNIADLAQSVMKSTALCLGPDSDYKYFKFCKAIRKAFAGIIEDEKALQDMYDIKVIDLAGHVDQSAAGYQQYIEMREKMLSEEMDLDINVQLDYATIVKICVENKMSMGIRALLCEIFEIKEE